MEALSRVFSRDRVQPLLLGSVKTNIGHSEAASGIASVIKSTLMLESGFIPPTHGVKKINPSIKTDEWSVKVVTEYERWPGFMDDQIRRISINSVCFHHHLTLHRKISPDMVTVRLRRRERPCSLGECRHA